MKFPSHKGALILIHNDHANYYQSVEDWIVEQENFGETPWFNWVSPEERQRAIDTDSVWTLRWYPHTPVGFIALAASTLEALMAAVEDD